MDTHLNDIDSLISFLVEYKNLLENNEIKSSNNLRLLLNNSSNYKDNYMETLYSILNYAKNIELDDHISNIIQDKKDINSNIREILPILLYYFADKL